MSEPYPVFLECYPRELIWGGDRLTRMFGKNAPFAHLAETWELSARADGMCRVINGEYSGLTFAQYLAAVPSACGNTGGGNGEKAPRFPLLVKFIDAADDLSVQVHPGDAYAAQTAADSGDTGKTEMWYVVAADEGAELILGMKEGATNADFRRALAGGDVSGLLRRVKVHAGEYFFIPAGLLHAICRGVVIAEIQQNSDLTYRVWDYDRKGADGQPRRLHLAQAADVVTPFTQSEIDAAAFSAGRDADNGIYGGELIVNCDYFYVHRVRAAEHVRLRADSRAFRSLLCTGGGGELRCGGCAYPLRAGCSVFLPAGADDAEVTGTDALISGCSARAQV